MQRIFALKAALKYVKINIDKSKDLDNDGKATSYTFSSLLVGTEKYRGMISTTESFLTDLLRKFDKPLGV